MQNAKKILQRIHLSYGVHTNKKAYIYAKGKTNGNIRCKRF